MFLNPKIKGNMEEAGQRNCKTFYFFDASIFLRSFGTYSILYSKTV